MAIPSSALIIDDEIHVRLFVRLLLRELGITTCFEAENIDQAFSIIATDQPGLLVLDINMPGGSGIELLRRIRRADEETYIVILTAEAASATVMTTLRAGADGFIRKDLPRQKILEELRAIMADPADEADET